MPTHTCPVPAPGSLLTRLGITTTGKGRYQAFCAHFNLPLLPVKEAIILQFVAHLFAASLSHQTIRSYLSAVRHLQIVNGFPDPAMESFPRLTYALKGVRRERPLSQRQTRLPITPELLRRIYHSWAQEPQEFDRTMLWAAFCLGFFGFMRSGEFTCPSMESFSPDMLTHQDIAVDSHISPRHLTVRVKRSKNDPFGAGTTLHIGTTGDYLCPVAAMLGYLAIRPNTNGPLFVFSDGSTLSRTRLVQSLRQALTTAGVDVSRYNGHSFRIGAATTVARAGMSDSLIKTLGRWRSSAFTVYIRTPPQTLTAVSSILVRSTTSSST